MYNLRSRQVIPNEKFYFYQQHLNKDGLNEILKIGFCFQETKILSFHPVLVRKTFSLIFSISQIVELNSILG